MASEDIRDLPAHDAPACDTPVVSVIIPCFNGSEVLARSIESALAQDWPGVEVIVVDDGSTDDSASIAESYGDRVRCIRQANGGPAAARNAGIRGARGVFFQFLDADDHIAPDKLSRSMEALGQHPEADVLYGDCQMVDLCGNLLYEFAARPFARPPLSALLQRNRLQVSAVLVRRSAMERAGAFDPAMVPCEDWDMWLRLAHAGAVFVPVPGARSTYMRHPGSLSADCLRIWRASLRVLRRWDAANLPPDCRSAVRDGVREMRAFCARGFSEQYPRVGAGWMLARIRACIGAPGMLIPLGGHVWDRVRQRARHRPPEGGAGSRA